MPHREGAENEPEVLVRLAEEFHHEAAQPVAGDEAPKDGARGRRPPPDPPQNDEQQEALERRLVQLRRMPALGSAAGENHAPFDVRRSAVEFPVDEVADPAEPQADRRGGRGQVGYRIDRDTAPPAEPPQRDDCSDETAVEGHAAFPDRDDFRWMFKVVVGEIVEERIAESPAHKDPHRRVHDHVVDLIFGQRQSLRGRFGFDEKIRRRQPDQVHEPVPAELQRAEPEKNRVDVRIGDHVKDRRGSSACGSAGIIKEVRDGLQGEAQRNAGAPEKRRRYHTAMSAIGSLVLLYALGAAAVASSADSTAGFPAAPTDPRLPPSLRIKDASSPRMLDGDELLRIGDIHEVQNHLQEAMPYYQRALTAFRVTKNRRGEATSLMRIGAIQERQGQTRAAMASVTGAVAILKTLPDKGAYARSLLRLGRLSDILGDRVAAERSYEQALALLRQAHDSQAWTEGATLLGNLRIDDGRIEQGLALLDEALAEARRRQDLGQESNALLIIAGAHVRQERLDEARRLYEQALRLAEQQRDQRAEVGIRVALARLDAVLGFHQDGILMAKKALALYQALRDRLQEADTLALLGNLHQTQGDLAGAAEHHERALALYRALRDRAREAGSLVNLAVVYDAQGAPEDARETRVKAIVLLQSLSP